MSAVAAVEEQPARHDYGAFRTFVEDFRHRNTYREFIYRGAYGGPFAERPERSSQYAPACHGELPATTSPEVFGSP
jgi:hypothetical protein